MRILYLASGAIAVPSLRWLRNSPHDVVAVVTQPDRPAGRGRRNMPTPVKVHALDAGLELIQTDNVNDPAMLDRLRDYKPDLGIVASFSQKIGNSLLDAVPGGYLNIHPSLLPKYRGAAPVNWAIIRGETKTGVTIIRLVERMDAGPMLSVRETMIKPSETADELYQRLAGIACDALGAALARFDPAAPPLGTPQDDSQASLAPKLSKETGNIDFHRPASELVCWINGLYPWPAVQWMYVPAAGAKPSVVRIGRAALPEHLESDGPKHHETPGTILEDDSVAAVDGAFRILEIQPAGSRVMTWKDFVNGRHVRPGDRFELVE
ncbi:MAG: methionyl-tRNA formyltransferase [Phycisphaerae bacterium]|nr:methionyl-tRNA formyltransferase [Phycisphaerae bacterium]